MTAAAAAPAGVQFELPLSEEQVLGAALLGHLDGLDRLEPSDFTDPRRAAIAGTVKALQAQGAPTDPAAVTAALIASPEIRWTAGRNVAIRVAEMVSAVAVPASAGYHARLVAEASARRRLLRLAVEVEDLAATASIESVIGRVEALVGECAAAVRRVTG